MTDVTGQSKELFCFSFFKKIKEAENLLCADQTDLFHAGACHKSLEANLENFCN